MPLFSKLPRVAVAEERAVADEDLAAALAHLAYDPADHVGRRRVREGVAGVRVDLEIDGLTALHEVEVVRLLEGELGGHDVVVVLSGADEVRRARRRRVDGRGVGRGVGARVGARVGDGRRVGRGAVV